MTLDRPKIIKQLFNGYATVGNDSPFASVYPSSDPTVPQRKQDLVQAKKLLAQAGYPKGFQVTLTTEKYIEIPQLAQILAASAKKIGIDIKLNIITSDAYYGGTYSGGATGRGTTPWLNTPLNITDYGHRAVPNVVISSAFKTGGVWNSADYANKAFDTAVDAYSAALTLKEQRKYTGIAARILLRDTPVIIPYFYNWTQAGSKKVKGFKAGRDRHVSTWPRRRSPRSGTGRSGRAAASTQRPSRVLVGGSDLPVPAQAARLRADHAVHPQRARVRRRLASARRPRSEHPRRRSRARATSGSSTTDAGADRPLAHPVLGLDQPLRPG